MTKPLPFRFEIRAGTLCIVWPASKGERGGVRPANHVEEQLAETLASLKRERDMLLLFVESIAVEGRLAHDRRRARRLVERMREPTVV